VSFQAADDEFALRFRWALATLTPLTGKTALGLAAGMAGWFRAHCDDASFPHTRGQAHRPVPRGPPDLQAASRSLSVHAAARSRPPCGNNRYGRIAPTLRVVSTGTRSRGQLPAGPPPTAFLSAIQCWRLDSGSFVSAGSVWGASRGPSRVLSCVPHPRRTSCQRPLLDANSRGPTPLCIS